MVGVFPQVDATNIVNTQQLDDMEQKYRQKINALETQLAAQAQQLDDYKVQLQVNLGHKLVHGWLLSCLPVLK